MRRVIPETKQKNILYFRCTLFQKDMFETNQGDRHGVLKGSLRKDLVEDSEDVI